MSNTIRFSGMASGMDTDSIVKALLTPYQSKLDNAKQDKTLMEWKKDAYKDMNTKINSFYNKYVYKMSLNGTFNKTKTVVSNPNVITLDPNITIPAGTHTIKVDSMASGAVVSTSTIAGATKDTVLNTESSAKTFSLTVEAEGKSKTISVDVTQGMTIGQLETKVNEQITEDVNLSFKFDEKVRAFIVSSTGSGSKEKITLNAEAQSMLNASSNTAAGNDAKIIYNGGISITSATNKIEVNGLVFDIKGSSGEVISISSTKDTDGIVAFVKEFVDEYNKLAEEINTKLSADPARKYRPLTDEQKKEMSDTEVEQWEKKIKDSLWSNDSTLRDFNSMLRGTINNTVVSDNAFKILADIGIKTGDWREKGKLHLDETALRKAIGEDSDGVTKLLNTIGKSLDVKFKESSKSIPDIRSYNSFFNDKLLTTSISNKTKDITKAEEKYDAMEKIYYKKFTAMEKMMNQYNSQSSWLAQQTS